jgi:carbamoyltransferase
MTDVDCVAYPWNADVAALWNMCTNHPQRIPLSHWSSLALTGGRVIRDLMTPRRSVMALTRKLGSGPRRFYGVKHHLGHAACAYYTSNFEHAAILTIDGQGEDESASLGEWTGTRYRKFQSIHSPDSIGILYGMITDFLGMHAASDEYKVMGMAAYGDATRFMPALTRLVHILPGGYYRTWRTAMVFAPGYCDQMLQKILGIKKRTAGEPLLQIHFDLAAAMQQITEEVVFHLLRRLRALTDARDLCLAGGVFLNSVANGLILSSGLFERVHVPPVPGDHGGALGAALQVYHSVTESPRHDVGFTPFSGPGYDESSITSALATYVGQVVCARPDDIAGVVAARLTDGEVIGWFQGRMEYGPRALGHRSILADPRLRDARERVNIRIKHREPFRPFAGIVPLEYAGDWFQLKAASPYMQFVVPLRVEAKTRLAALDHFGTCRVQTVTQESDALMHSLLVQFGRKSGVPILLNTSFNHASEPIVCSPADAFKTFIQTDLDALVIGLFLVTKR